MKFKQPSCHFSPITTSQLNRSPDVPSDDINTSVESCEGMASLSAEVPAHCISIETAHQAQQECEDQKPRCLSPITTSQLNCSLDFLGFGLDDINRSSSACKELASLSAEVVAHCKSMETAHQAQQGCVGQTSHFLQPKGGSSLSGMSRVSCINRRMSRKSCTNRRMSHKVIPSNMPTTQQKPEFEVFRNLYGIVAETLDEEMPCATPDISIRVSSVSLTDKQVLLQKCNQLEPLPFKTAFSGKFLKKCKKIGEGQYGEVFLHASRHNNSVFKIIPIDGELLYNGERQKNSQEILSEVCITTELSNLNKDKRTNGFVQVLENMYVQGEYPEELVHLWNNYKDVKGTENDCPTMFTSSQQYVILELAHGGVDMEKFEFQNAREAYAAFLQIAHALAVAEEHLQFEHRDLHWGNVLLSKTSKTHMTYVLREDDIEIIVPTYGVKATIIDYTLSRMTCDSLIFYNDLSLDPTLFESQGDYQYDIYRLMREKCGDVWSHFNPTSNVYWLHYIASKMLASGEQGVRYSKVSMKNKRNTKLHHEGLNLLSCIEKSLLHFESAVQFISQLDQ